MSNTHVCVFCKKALDYDGPRYERKQGWWKSNPREIVSFDICRPCMDLQFGDDWGDSAVRVIDKRKFHFDSGVSGGNY